MNKLKLFLVAISFIITANAWGCCDAIYWGGINLFVMRTPIGDAIETSQQQNIDETINFWYNYTGGALSKDTLAYAINDLDYKTFTDRQQSENVLTAYLTKKNDRTALNYLRYNSEIKYACQGSEWSYHSPYTNTQLRSLLASINRLPATGRLANRVKFLKLRCLFHLKRYNECINMWNTSLKNIKDTPLRNRMEGYVGGAYYWTNRFNQAVDIYQRIGDMQSINAAVNKMLTVTSKEALYAHDPNSIALEYAMQDFANSYYHCMTPNATRVNFSDELSSYMEAGEVDESVTRDYNRAIAFAERVVKEGKNTNPMFWAGFIGFMKWVHGDADEAYQWLDKAQGMVGNEQMAYCVRLYKFLAAINMNNKPANFDEYFLTEYHCYIDNARNYKMIWEDYYSSENSDIPTISPEKEMACYALTSDITPEACRYYASRGTLVSTLLHGADNRYGIEGGITSMGLDYINKLDKVNTIEQDQQLLQQLNSESNSQFVKSLISICGDKVLSNDLLNDIIGTKMLRALRFSEAQECLSKVSLDYLNTQGIAEYLAQPVLKTKPFGHVAIEEGQWQENAKLKTNVKLLFAKDMASKQSQINLMTGNAKAQAQYDLAVKLYQALPIGDQWALTEYSWTYSKLESELTPNVVKILSDAIFNSDDIQLKKKIWYGMASIPSDEHYVDKEYGENYDTWDWNFNNITPWQSEAYASLRSCVISSDNLYRTCDMLRSYIKQNTY